MAPELSNAGICVSFCIIYDFIFLALTVKRMLFLSKCLILFLKEVYLLKSELKFVPKNDGESKSKFFWKKKSPVIFHNSYILFFLWNDDTSALI